MSRPQSSRDSIKRVVELLSEVISKEAAKIIQEKNLRNVEDVWEAVKVRPALEVEMRNILKRVDRMHVLYVYSRFLNSRAVGPPLVKKALEKTETRR